jgi:hypothetical protein
MSLMGLIAAAQQGLLIATVGAVVGVEESVARAALERLLRLIARRLGERAADRGEHDVLLDVIARGGFQRYLDDSRVLFGRNAVRDGEQVLDYLYGSLEAARAEARTVGPPEGLDADVFVRLMTLAATLLLAALARRLEQARKPHSETGPPDPWTELGRAIVRGLVDGSLRALSRRHASFRRRMKASRRRPQHGTDNLHALMDDLLDQDITG